MADLRPAVLYHYTTAEALRAILESQQLKPSLQRTRPQDVRYGEGQYLTDIAPGTMTGAQLSRFLLGRPYFAQRCTHFLALDVEGLPIRQGRKGVFVIANENNLPIAGRIIATGRSADDLPSSQLAP